MLPYSPALRNALLKRRGFSVAAASVRRQPRRLRMVNPSAKLAFGLLLGGAVVLMVGAVWLWLHNVIILAAPVAFLALGCGWAGIDNALIYPKERARREGTDVLEAPGHPEPAPPPSAADAHKITVPR